MKSRPLGLRIRRTASGCLAPSVHMYLAPDGDVRACCRNWDAVGNVTETSLLDIWSGTLRRSMADALERGDFGGGCGQCGAEIDVEGRPSSYPQNFDRFQPPRGHNRRHAVWPSRIEFNLSNSCNLMCVQCDGFLSSMIRTHREGLPPMPKVYGDAFFADLESFIPHLQEAQFAGGEPFLARENFRVWDMIERINPDLSVSVVTNATQWNDRIERIGRTLRMGYTFSIDGVTKDTYEKIRINADFDVVMTNISRFIELAHAQDRHCEVNFCLMRQNYHEFGALLLWADSLGLDVNVCVVRAPEHSSVAAMPADDIAAAAELLRLQDAIIRPQLTRNRSVWATELNRVERWAEADPTTRRKLWWSEDWWSPENHPADVPGASSLGLRTLGGTGEADTDVERRHLGQWCGGGPVHEIEFDFHLRARDGEPDHPIASLSASLQTLLQISPDEVVGQPSTRLTGMIEPLYGRFVSLEVIDESGFRMEGEVVHESIRMRSVAVARYDDRGYLTSATMLLAFAQRSPDHQAAERSA